MFIVDKTTGAQLTAVDFNQIPDEIENVITVSGQTPGPTFGIIDQLSKGIYRMASAGSFYTDSGAVNAYVLTSSALVDNTPGDFEGKLIRFVPVNTNTGASTVEINGETAVDIVDVSGIALVGGEIVADREVIATFISSAYRILTSALTVDIEVDNAITDSGQTPTQADQFELSKGLSNFSGNGNFYSKPVGASSTYVLGLNGTQKEPTSMFDGLEVRFEADFTNTTNTTITMPTLGNFPLRNFDNTELQVGTIIANSTVSCFYDSSLTAFKLPLLPIPADTANTNSTLVRRDSSGGIFAETIRLESIVGVTLASTAHAFQIGDSGGVNLAMATNEIQARNNGAVTTLNLNQDGGNISIGSSPNSNIFIGAESEVFIRRDGGLTKLFTQTGGIEVNGSLGNAAGGLQDTKIILNNSGNAGIARLGFEGTADLFLRSDNSGGNLVLSARSSDASTQVLLTGDPDAEGVGVEAVFMSRTRLTSTSQTSLTSVAHAFQIGDSSSLNLAFDTNEVQARNNGVAATLALNESGGDIQLGAVSAANIFIDDDGEISLDRAGGLVKFQTKSDGVTIFGSLSNPATGGNQDTIVALNNFVGNPIANVGFQGGANLIIENLNDGGGITLRADDAGGTSRNILVGDPDDETTLTASTNLNLIVNDSENALVAFASAGVDIYHNAIAMARTATAGNGGFEVNNTVTAAGFERVLTESDLGGQVFNVYKDSSTFRDGIVTSPDPDLTVSLLAGSYKFTMYLLWVNSLNGSDFKFNFEISSGALGGSYQQSNDNELPILNTSMTTDSSSTVPLPNASSNIILTGTFNTSATAQFSFAWSQQNNDNNNLTLVSGSWMTVTRLA